MLVVDLCVNMSKGKRREARLAKKAAKAEKVLEKQNEIRSKKVAATVSNTDTIENQGADCTSRQALKLAKATAKGQFSRARNQLLLLLDRGESEEDVLIETRNKVRTNFNSYIESLVKLLENTEKKEENISEIESLDREIIRAEEEVKSLFQKFEVKNTNKNRPREANSLRYEIEVEKK